jgi:hypothetical protein
MDPMAPRAPRGDCPELTGDAERAAEEMVTAAIRKLLDDFEAAADSVRRDRRADSGLRSVPSAADWLDNRRPTRFRRVSRRGL